jgi:tRNA U34 2-thiouridine synthase MnmA/TrmU
MQKKALALLSGGLDSTLAVKVMLDQGIEVEALNFISPFCNCTGKNAGCKSEAVRVAAEFNIPIKVMNKGVEYLEIVRNPRHGYGKGMNPASTAGSSSERGAWPNARRLRHRRVPASAR